jgi:competence protein ComEA
MFGLTDAERRGARVLAVLLVLGTLTDLVRARHPQPQALPEGRPVVAAAPADSAPVGSAPGGEPPPTARAPLDLNTATAAELDALPGIGPVLAARIVEHRRLHGAFRSVEELRSVPGIGPRLLARLRPSLREPPG